MLDTATKNCQAKSMRLYGLDSEAGTVERIRRAIAADEGLTRSIAKAGGVRRDTVTYFTGADERNVEPSASVTPFVAPRFAGTLAELGRIELAPVETGTMVEGTRCLLRNLLLQEECKALYVYHTKNPRPSETPPTLNKAIRMMAKLDGFIGRNGDGEPGTISLWRGIQRLDDITEIFIIMSTIMPAAP